MKPDTHDRRGPLTEAAIRAAMLLGLAAILLLAGAGRGQAAAAVPDVISPDTIVQPEPLQAGPGSVDVKHRDWRISQGGQGADAWYAFEPIKPRPERAPLAIITHGYYEFAGYDRLYELIRHTVQRGNVVVFPRWQTGVAEPCPGPFNIEPCIDSASQGIHDGIAFLRGGENRVQPRLDRTSYYGYSYGGILTANLANRYRQLELPRPRAIFLDDPHDGELAGLGEPALDDSLAGIPSDVKFECHSGAEGVIGVPRLKDGSCNAVFPLIGHVPNRNKSLVMTRTDGYGTPTLSSVHGVCAAEKGTADAYDWRFCWKAWDALRSCGYWEKSCAYALGRGRKHTWMGRWSDGTPVTPLVAQKAAPLRP